MLKVKRYLYLLFSCGILIACITGFLIIENNHKYDSIKFRNHAMINKSLIIKNINDTMEMSNRIAITKLNY